MAEDRGCPYGGILISARGIEPISYFRGKVYAVGVNVREYVHEDVYPLSGGQSLMDEDTADAFERTDAAVRGHLAFTKIVVRELDGKFLGGLFKGGQDGRIFHLPIFHFSVFYVNLKIPCCA